MDQNNEILLILQKKKPEWSKRFKLKRLALFGSYARGEENHNDIDILVDFDPSIGLDFVDLAEEIESTIGRPVDVVPQRAIKPRYWKEIESDLIDV